MTHPLCRLADSPLPIIQLFPSSGEYLESREHIFTASRYRRGRLLRGLRHGRDIVLSSFTEYAEQPQDFFLVTTHT